MGKLYGPSDVLSIQLADGHGHTFFEPHQRELSPGYGIEERSLPVLDCARCAEWCKSQGWHPSSLRVQKTADELEFEAEAQLQGNLNMRLAAEAMGNAMGRMAQEEQQSISRTRRGRKGALAK